MFETRAATEHSGSITCWNLGSIACGTNVGTYNSAGGGMDVWKISCGGRRTCQHRHGGRLLRANLPHIVQRAQPHMPRAMRRSRLGYCLTDACIGMDEVIVTRAMP